MICRAIATQFIKDNLIAMFEFVLDGDEVKKVTEKHYELVSSDNLSKEEIRKYNELPDQI